MATTPFPEPLRRRTPIAELFEETFRLYRRNFLLMAGLYGASQLPLILLSLPLAAWQAEWQASLAQGRSGPGGAGTEIPPWLTEQIAIVVVVALILFVAVLVLGVLGMAAITYIAGRARSSERPPLREVLHALRRLSGALLGYVAVWMGAGLVLLAGALVVFGVFVLLIFVSAAGPGGTGQAAFAILAILGTVVLMGLGIAVIVRLSLAVPAIVLERRGPIESLRRSWELVRGSTWRTFGILLLASVVISVIGGLVSPFFLPGVMEGVMTGSPTTYIFVTLVSGVVQVLLGPIIPIIVTLLYFDYARQQTARD